MFRKINEIDHYFKRKFGIYLTTFLIVLSIILCFLMWCFDSIFISIIALIVSTIAMIFNISLLKRKDK